MDHNDLYALAGEMGIYQVCLVICMILVYMSCIDPITMIFVNANMPHWCRIDGLDHLPFDQQKYIGIPYSAVEDDLQAEYSSCQMFAFNYSAFDNDELDKWNRTLMINDSTPVIDCSQWIYDQSKFVSTIVSRVRHTVVFFQPTLKYS